MSVNYDIDFDTKSLNKALKNTRLKMPSVAKLMMGKVGGKVRTQAKRNINGGILKRSANQDFAKATWQKSYKNFTGLVGNSDYRAGWLEFGVTINAKNKKYLTFKVDDHFVKVESVVIEPKYFLKTAVDEYWSTDKAKKIMDDTLQKKLEKYWNKENNK